MKEKIVNIFIQSLMWLAVIGIIVSLLIVTFGKPVEAVQSYSNIYPTWAGSMQNDTNDTSWTDICSGSATDLAINEIRVGFYYNSSTEFDHLYRAFLCFDLSSIDETITGAELYLKVISWGNPGSYEQIVRPYWAATANVTELALADFHNLTAEPYTLGPGELEGDSWGNGEWIVMTLNEYALRKLNSPLRESYAQIALADYNDRAGITPTGLITSNEYQLKCYDDSEAGLTSDPYLRVYTGYPEGSQIDPDDPAPALNLDNTVQDIEDSLTSAGLNTPEGRWLLLIAACLIAFIACRKSTLWRTLLPLLIFGFFIVMQWIEVWWAILLGIIAAWIVLSMLRKGGSKHEEA